VGNGPTATYVAQASDMPLTTQLSQPRDLGSKVRC